MGVGVVWGMRYQSISRPALPTSNRTRQGNANAKRDETEPKKGVGGGYGKSKGGGGDGDGDGEGEGDGKGGVWRIPTAEFEEDRDASDR